MRNNHIIIVFTLLVSISIFCASCEDWLDVNPKSEVKSEELLKTENGCRVALFGIYTQMTDRSLYGGNLTMGFLDVLAQYYVITLETQPYYRESIYDYKAVESRIGGIWSNLYFSIANCNNLLGNIEGEEQLFTGDNYNFFVAETKATRAYLHFDLLRLFAPSVEGGREKLAIPFVDKVSKTAFPQLTVDQVLERIIIELNEARQLLAEVDPIGPAFDDYNEKDFPTITEMNNDNGFLYKRRSRMNYYAITALLARVHLYNGDKDQALQYALEVINSGKFGLITEDKLVGDMKDIIFSDEIIFSLYNDQLKKKSDAYFKRRSSEELQITKQRINEIFEVEKYGALDYRMRYQFGRNEGELMEYVAKYNSFDYFTGRDIPMIRLSEMYYIAAECESSSEKAFEYIEAVRIHRGYPEYANVSELNLQAELYKEYKKEFVAEGQLFYYLKRNNIKDIEYSQVEGSDEVYILPIPDVEKEFGDIK